MDARLWPATKSKVHTPHDTNKIADGAGNFITCRGISVDVAGVIHYKDADGTARVTGTLAAGIIHPISTNLITTGTTATGIVVYW
jgi:hypothetical protein